MSAKATRAMVGLAWTQRVLSVTQHIGHLLVRLVMTGVEVLAALLPVNVSLTGTHATVWMDLWA